MNRLIQIIAIAMVLVAYGETGPAKNVAGKRVVCYFGSWAVYRYGLAKIGVEDIQPGLCTHFIYTFIGLDESSSSVVLLDAWNDVGDEWKKGTMTQICDKARAAGTKCMVAVGGWNEGSLKYSRVVCDASRRAIFVKSIVDFVKKYNLDGFDLDWEYPGQRGGAPGDKNCFSALLSDLRPIFDQNNWELSAAVSANAKSLEISYNVPDVAAKLDFINVMAYDLHGSWESVTGHHTALYGRPGESPEDAHLNVDAAIKGWLSLGAPASKLNLGLGSYGRSFTLQNPNNFGIGAPANPLSPAPSGWVQEAGFYGFMDICYNNQSTWTTEWDDYQKVPYAHAGNKWVGYDDVPSIREKTCFAKNMDLGGVMFWTVETDDFRGVCNQGKYPLISSAVNALSDPSCGSNSGQQQPPAGQPPIAPPVTTQAPPPVTEAPTVPPTQGSTQAPQGPGQEVTTTALPPTTTTSSSQVPRECSAEGQRIRDPLNCAIFYTCISDGSGGFRQVQFNCPGGLGYDTTLGGCNYRTLVRC